MSWKGQLGARVKMLGVIGSVRWQKGGARNPAEIEKKRNERGKRFQMKKTSQSFCKSVGSHPRIKKMTKNFRPLSLKAPWNCVAMRLQKPSRHFFSGAGMERFTSAGMQAHPSASIKS